MNDDLSLNEIKKEWHGSLRSYLIGFFASLFLTAISFFIVHIKLFSGYTLMSTLGGLAIVQAIFQVVFFLHLGKEDRPQWETLIFLFMVMVLLVIVLGSLWIMFDLDERVMSGMGKM